MEGPEGDAAAVSMAGISAVDGSVILAERTFQFWPETLNVEPEIGWQFKEIPGLSHSIAQWTQNGGRTFSFDVVFSRFMKPTGNQSALDAVRSLGNMNAPNSQTPIDNRPYNVSVKEEIQWLRQFYLPDYVEATVSGVSATVSQPPPIAMICFPNMGLNEDTSDVVWAVMTGAPETYTLCFPNGEPRLASVSLTFKQVIQWPGQGIVLKPRLGIQSLEDNIAAGGGRPKNNINNLAGP
jgi:hypothetical protein